MKKSIALALILILIAGLLCACGDTKTPPADTNNTVTPGNPGLNELDIPEEEPFMDDALLKDMYDEAIAHYEQDTEHLRHPGELQKETMEIMLLEDNNYYQTYVDYENDIRYVWVTRLEAQRNGEGWIWAPIGTEMDYMVEDIGKIVH